LPVLWSYLLFREPDELKKQISHWKLRIEDLKKQVWSLTDQAKETEDRYMKSTY